MNACRQDEQLAAFLDEELAPQERVSFEAHLADCAACRDQRSVLRELCEALLVLPAIEPSPGFEARFWTRVSAHADAPAGWLSWLRARLGWRELLAGLGGSALATAALLLALRSGTPPIDPDWAIVAEADQLELLATTDIELLDVMEILEAWDGQEI